MSEEYAPPLSSISPESVAEDISEFFIGAAPRRRRRVRRRARPRRHVAPRHVAPRHAAPAALGLSRGYAVPGASYANPGAAPAVSDDSDDSWAEEQNAAEEDADTDEAEDAVVGARAPVDPKKRGLYVKGGWYRRPFWADDLFRKNQNKEPSDGDLFQLRKLVKYTNDGVAAGNEATFEAGQEMIAYYTRKAVFPGPRARAKLAQRAQQTVAYHVSLYNQAHHHGFWDSINPIKAVTAAAKWAGRAVGTVAHVAGAAIHEAADVMGHIPIVGGPLHTVLDAANPFAVIEHIAKGERIDKAVLGDLKNKLAAVKEVAPYAAAVASMVPGVGSSVAAALTTAAALASGRSITDAVVEGVRGALPGGQLAASAFDTAVALGKGKRIDQALLDAARNQLPAEARGAFDTGLAVIHGQNLQKALVSGVQSMGKEQLAKLADMGDRVVGATETLSKLRAMVPDPQHAGFNLALGVMSHTGVTPASLYAIRMRLSPVAKVGFDKGLISQTKRAEAHVKKLVKLAARGIPGTLVIRSADPKKNGRQVSGSWRAARPGQGTQGTVVHGRMKHVGWWNRAA